MQNGGYNAERRLQCRTEVVMQNLEHFAEAQLYVSVENLINVVIEYDVCEG